MRTTLRNIAIAAGVAYGPTVLIHGFCITGWGGWAIPGSEFLILLPLAGAALAVLVFLYLLVQRRKQDALRILAVEVGLIVLFVPALGASLGLRTLGFYLASTRTEPVIAAIEQYVRDHGGPPNDLGELVPAYIPRLPTRVPEFRIIVGEQPHSPDEALCHGPCAARAAPAGFAGRACGPLAKRK